MVYNLQYAKARQRAAQEILIELLQTLMHENNEQEADLAINVEDAVLDEGRRGNRVGASVLGHLPGVTS